MGHTCTIYVLFGRSGNVDYVGRTRRPIAKRIYEHRRVLGFKPRFEIVDTCTTDCRDVERMWIEHYRLAGCQLRNISYGQGPHFLPESSRAKISAALTGRPVTWGAKISAAQKGVQKQWSEEGRDRVRVNQFNSGEDTFAKMTPAQQEAHRTRARLRWQDPGLAARMSVGHAKGRNLSEESRSRRNEKLKQARLNDPRASEYAKMGMAALRASYPDIARTAATKFWDDLRQDPIKFKAYIERRAVAIAAGKAAKRAEGCA